MDTRIAGDDSRSGMKVSGGGSPRLKITTEIHAVEEVFPFL